MLPSYYYYYYYYYYCVCSVFIVLVAYLYICVLPSSIRINFNYPILIVFAFKRSEVNSFRKKLPNFIITYRSVHHRLKKKCYLELQSLQIYQHEILRDARMDNVVFCIICKFNIFAEFPQF